MIRKPTLVGVAAPAQVNERPSGRYSVQAPDAPIGSILRVVAKDGITRFVEVLCPHEKRLFVGIDGELVDFYDWEFATRTQVSDFKFGRRVGRFADQVDLRGAPAFAESTRELSPDGRRTVLEAVAEELKIRGKPGKASQLLACIGEK